MKDIKVFLIFLTSAVCCYVLHERTFFSAILASSLIGFLITFIPWKKWTELDVESIAYSGTFAGMSASFHMTQLYYFLLSSLIATIIFKYGGDFLKGFGGKLGTIAFISVVVFLL